MAVIEVARDGHIATVTLNRADRRNAVNAEMMQELERVSREFGQDEQTRVVIFRAEGRDFSVGADLSAPPSSRPATDPDLDPDLDPAPAFHLQIRRTRAHSASPTPM